MNDEIVIIDGVAYRVVKAQDAAGAEADGMYTLAAVYRERSIRRSLLLQRFDGREFYMAFEFEKDGQMIYSEVKGI